MDVTGVGFVVFAVQGVGTDTRQVGSIQRVKVSGNGPHTHTRTHTHTHTHTYPD